MSFVIVEKPRPYITLITLNRPERMNAMAFDVLSASWTFSFDIYSTNMAGAGQHVFVYGGNSDMGGVGSSGNSPYLLMNFYNYADGAGGKWKDVGKRAGRA